MADSANPPRDGEAGNGVHKSVRDAADIAALRAIILGPDLPRIAALRARLDDLELRADDIGEVLPQVLLQHAHDPNLTRALTPPLEKAITASVKRNPQPLADALFPVMGPAIRKAVSSGLTGSVESLNRTLENSLSWRSMRWRMEAFRTGKSFAEVVLLKTMLYRVEQVFLIERKTGLLLQHVKVDSSETQDADMVSGMLTAIRSFVQDSFSVAENDSLEALKVGELSVWIEPGPHAILAAVIRGSAPREFRRTLGDTLEAIHLGFGGALENFSGDASVFDDARPALEACLQSQVLTHERKRRPWSAWFVVGLAAATLLVWAGFRHRDTLRWTSYVDSLRAEPGLVVISAGRHGGKFVVSGLRDPLARDPQTLVAQSGLADDAVVGQWAPYQALDRPMVLARAAATLQPPDGITLTFKDGVLSSRGPAPVAWVMEARRTAPLLGGVTRFDAATALDGIIRPAIAGIETETLLFPKGSSRFKEGQEDALRRIAGHLHDLDIAATAAGIRFRVDIVGHTDEDGAPELNLPLSRARAETVRAALTAAQSAHVSLTETGVGSTAPVALSQDEEGKQQNRRVAVRVKRLQ